MIDAMVAKKAKKAESSVNIKEKDIKNKKLPPVTVARKAESFNTDALLAGLNQLKQQSMGSEMVVHDLAESSVGTAVPNSHIEANEIAALLGKHQLSTVTLDQSPTRTNQGPNNDPSRLDQNWSTLVGGPKQTI